MCTTLNSFQKWTLNLTNGNRLSTKDITHVVFLEISEEKNYPKLHIWNHLNNNQIWLEIVWPFCRTFDHRICVCISRTFMTRSYWPKLGCGLYTEYYVLLTTEPATSVLYVVKLPVETASVWDCYLASYCTRTNSPKYYRCIGIFWLHKE
jgi:hypothetical protein